MKRSDRITAFVESLHSWYLRHKRALPWRDIQDKNPTDRAYKILVSEVMLQQTQVPRVIIKYKEFIQRFSHITGLAKSSNSEIIITWRGMGYNSRALRLRDAAKTIVKDHGGVFPSSMEELLKIKGLGHYTAAAVRNFAFRLPTAMIDTNVRRVLHRSFFGPENEDGTWRISDRVLLPLCDDILREWMKQGYTCFDFFAALMDYGSLVQTKSNPKWEICVLTERGIMKTTRKNLKVTLKSKKKKEPGRQIGGRFTPNRIVRGRIIEALRDAPQGLSLDRIGSEVAIDWNASQRPWLRDILQKLSKDALIKMRKKKYALSN